jgi:membrane-associated protein
MAASTEGSGFFLDPVNIIKTVGLIGIVFIIFAESGLLIGFFLPGDSLLFTAGFFASQGFFDIKGSDGATVVPGIWLLLPLCFIAAVLGDNVGYWTGQKFGPKLFSKQDSLLFKKEYIVRAQHFYEKHGGKTILLARFVPIVRTFAPIVAGIGKMKYSTFFFFNIIGGFLFAVCVTLAGFFLGQVIPDIDKFLIPIVALIILASVAPPAYHILKEKESREKLWMTAKSLLKRKKKEEPVTTLQKQEIESK